MFLFFSYLVTVVVLLVELHGLYLFYKGYKAQLLGAFAAQTALRYREKFWVAYDVLIGLLIVVCIYMDFAPISLSIFLAINLGWIGWAIYQVRFKHKF